MQIQINLNCSKKFELRKIKGGGCQVSVMPKIRSTVSFILDSTYEFL